MAEPCAIYSTRQKTFSVTEVEELAPNAKAERLAGTAESPERIRLSWENASVVLSLIPYEGLDEHLEGFKGFAWKLGNEEMTQNMFHLFKRFDLVAEAWGTMSEPQITPEIEGFLGRFAGSTHGVVFRDNILHTSEMKPFLGADGFTEAELTYWPSSLKRKQASMTRFQEMEIHVAESLPPIIADEELDLRPPREIALRAVGLFHIAGISLPNGMSRAEAREALADYPEALSPAEKEFLGDKEATEEETIQFAWRIEALAVLAWALRILPELPAPNALIDVPQLADSIRKIGLQGLHEIEKLRPADEILDALDFVYRARWVTTEARIKEIDAPEQLHPGVLMERHHAFNWLVRFENADWDDVKTPT